MQHKGWYSRGYLPHFDGPEVRQMITFRLADAMPAAQVAAWKQQAERDNDAAMWKYVEKYLDAGYGCCCLGDAKAARLVEDALLHFDGERYRLLAWVVMPNHVHAMAEMWDGYPLSSVVHSWKSFTANRINALLNRKGVLWQRETFDRYIRNEKHFAFALDYIHHNPVKAGLVAKPEDWPFSSARLFSMK